MFDLAKINFKNENLDLTFFSQRLTNLTLKSKCNEFMFLEEKSQNFENFDSNNNLSKTIVYVGDLETIPIFTFTCYDDELTPCTPDPKYLREIYIGLKKTFKPYSEYLIMYYLYRLKGIRTNFSIEQLQQCFFKNKETRKPTNTAELNINLISPRQTTNNNNNSIHCETLKCSTCNASPYMATPEKDHLNQYNYIFDLHHLPVFDENTGEFLWTTNESNWRTARNSILKSEDICNTGSISLNHGGFFSLSSSFVNVNVNREEDADKLKWEAFKKEGQSGTFIEELNNILKDFDELNLNTLTTNNNN